jgi:phosphocarrier protein
MDKTKQSSTKIIRESVEIANRKGLHARAAAQFVKEASKFKANIYVQCRDRRVPATSIMGLMMLTAGLGTVIQIEATGLEALEAIQSLKNLVLNKFSEE